jgi:hypothetical protein
MNFGNVIVELASREDLKAWNMEQRAILSKMIRDHILDKTSSNFVDRVQTFAKFFADYFNSHGETPSVKEAENFMKVV